ncbi:TetR/AcrR family transcriptional regulator [Mycobacterium sp. E1747]|uniref:TetR/AcrR family transcriptional regulator n=1 Tax=Mycobacterium sp. E1747 TaxID=1834128 RepID=UPI0007FF6BA7|nr:TetR/AcrR family transcriptional regulator [Mycobacterium sp. E1747]OBH07231.1 TetR family transcriptional regulator [Mycobacterium sp. E1747]
MPRSGHEARARLQQAAIELFGEHGFDAVTTAEIAERAGVTERTYFRHFPDKREVLFDGENQLTELLTAALAEIPESEPPLPTLRRAFRTLVPMLEGNRATAEPLWRIVAATPTLWERAAAKEARLVDRLAEALRARGIDGSAADLAARTGWGTLAHAMRTWRADPGGGLERHVERAFRELRALVAKPD